MFEVNGVRTVIIVSNIFILGSAANMSARSESRFTSRSQSSMNGETSKKKSDNTASTSEVESPVIVRMRERL